MTRTRTRISLIAALGAALFAAQPAAAAEQDLKLSGTKFVGATAFTRAGGGAPRLGYLLFYRSPLGEELRLRPVAQDELDEIRRVCFVMVREAEKAGAEIDDYFIEFGATDDAPADVPYDQRFAFVFTAERGCEADPTPAVLR